MVSIQIPGVLRFYRVKPNGAQEPIYGSAIAALGPSGSVDGVIASTPDTWTYLGPQNSGQKILQVNDQLLVTFTPNAAQTTDASDSEFAIPITYFDGTRDNLGGPDSATEWDVFVLGDVALIANREYPVCAKTVRRSFALGGGKIFASIEDNS